VNVPLALASSSPRRQELLKALGLPFIIVPAEVDERQQPGESPAALVQSLSQAKATAVATRYPDAVVVAADTVVVLDGLVLGKPADAAEAARYYLRLEGFATQQVLEARLLEE